MHTNAYISTCCLKKLSFVKDILHQVEVDGVHPPKCSIPAFTYNMTSIIHQI